MNIILQIVLGTIFAECALILLWLYIGYEDRKEESRRCLECGFIPLEPDPRFDAGRAKLDAAWVKTGHFVLCGTCGEMKTKEDKE